MNQSFRRAEADEILLLNVTQQRLGNLHGAPRILMYQVVPYVAFAVDRQAEAAAVAIADGVAGHARRTTATDRDASHLVGKDLVVAHAAEAVLTDEDAGVSAIVYLVALDKRSTLLKYRNPGPTISKDVVLLNAASALLTDKHAGIAAGVYLITADLRVCSREDGDTRPPVEANLVVLDEPSAKIAHEHADALATADHVVQNVTARVHALHDDAVARLGGDGALLEHKCRAGLD
mmetsp:Transcript_8089/g.17743  ORF Transcript_8089/g.17743 Transcript_8089/m.17743 type:complete len:234 (-) Transcript_8089:997-1698(-)